ncbi:MAG: NAD(P)H-dependent oxidoreductase [Oenococcus sp.]|uniref:NAD(P)H-dependent oxidoreductase n=1 Tax=Oenococcus TaxID=46254 RepID=UPI0021E890D4|nr:NAD(P)H-dependent oxidoreductase [Oenococcus kitaharae]MCV3295566.1 NAD(P)H-dependent oxidoreductase [Oenococcus kitaharae]
MQAVIILDHPYDFSVSHNQVHRRAYSAALAQRAYDDLTDAGYDVDLIDLEKDHFDPVMHEKDLVRWRSQAFVDQQSHDYFQRLQRADEIVFIFPIWWEMMPALTKGFFDKVFAKGEVKVVNGQRQLFQKKTKIRVLTAIGTPNLIYKWHYGNPIGKMLQRGVFAKIGLKDFKIKNFNAEDEKEKKRLSDLNKVKKVLL